jgi:NCAIR mutase (PurE)-related protein
VKNVLQRLQAGELTVEEAEAELRRVQLEELGGRARLDLGRTTRRGLPEVILAAGKAPADVGRLAAALAAEQGQACVSRMDERHRAAVIAAAGAAGLVVMDYGSRSARVRREGFPVPAGEAGRVAIITAGTSDREVAEEARMVIEACGQEARLEADVGVAGLHRLLGPLAELLTWDADVLVVAAGMDGVLPGVVAGLVDRPVIGVPVSTGYGAGGKGKAALLTMLQSCATGLTVVNIDNGVGAGASAVLIAARAAAARRRRPAPANPRSAPAARPG